MVLVKQAPIGECVRCFKGTVWLAKNSYATYKVCERCLRVVDGTRKLNIAVRLVDGDSTNTDTVCHSCSTEFETPLRLAQHRIITGH